MLDNNGVEVYGEVKTEDAVTNGYLQFGKYVNSSRHIPRMYDGLKPVYRCAMQVLYNNSPTRPTKVKAILGDIGKLWPHSDSSWGEVLAKLVYQGFAIGQGEFGRATLRGENIAKAADRYIEARINPAIKDQIAKIYNQVPKENSYTGQEMMEYVPTPLPLSLVFGCQGIGLGVATQIPPFTPKSLYEAYLSDDPTKLELNGGMQLIKNKGDGTLDGLKRFWETGRGSLGIKIPVEDMWIEGDHGFLIHCDVPLFKPKFDALEQWVEEEKVGIMDLTDTEQKIFIYRTKGTRSVTDEEIGDIVNKITYRKRGYFIQVYNPVKGMVQPIGVRDWIGITLNNYKKLHERYIKETIQATQEEQWSWEYYLDIVKILNDEKNDAPFEEIAKVFEIPVSVVEMISRRSVGTYRKMKEDGDGIKQKIKACKDKIKYLNSVNVDDDIKEYIDSIVGRIETDDDGNIISK